MLVGELGVGDRDLALQRFEPRLFRGIGGSGDALVERLVDERVDAADEEARHTRDLVRVAAFPGEGFEPAHIGLGDLGIDLLREQEGDVDVDALADQGADGRQPGLGAGHLDHQILAPDLAPQPARLLDRLMRLQRQIGRDFEADEAVAPLGLVIDRAQRVGALLDVADRQLLEQGAGVEVAVLLRRRDQLVVIVAVADRLFEDRRVRGDPAQPVIGDQLGQLPGLQQFAADEIEPHRLADIR